MTRRPPARTLRDLAAILLAGGILLLPSLPAVDLFNPDEPREAEIAREMRASGDLVVPRFNGCPFLEKPPFFYWASLASSRLGVAGREAAARLPSAAAGLGLLVIAYFLGKELYDRRTARAGAFLLLTTFQFWWLARRALLDMTLAFFVGAAMLCFLLGHRRPSARLRWFLLGGAACAGAALTKGLIGLLIPGLAIAAYLWWKRDLRVLASPALVAAAAIPLAALGVWVVLLALRTEGACYVREFLVENHLKRFMGAGYGGHRQPFWYYLESLATDFEPWVLFLPGAVVGLWPGLRIARRGGASGPVGSGRPHPGENEPRADTGPAAADAFLHAWLLPPLLLLSAASSKRSLYLLPLALPAALLVAAWWRQRRWARRTGDGERPDALQDERRLPRGLSVLVPASVLLVLGVLLALALPVIVAALLTGAGVGSAGDLLSAPLREPSGIPAGVALLVATLAVALLVRRNRGRGAAAVVLLVWVLFLVAGSVLLPLAGPRLSARQIGEVMRRHRDRGTKIAAYRLTEGSLGQFLFYSEGTVDWIGRRSREPESACADCRSGMSAEEFLSGPGRRACLLLEADYAKLAAPLRRGRVLARGKVGGASYVLLASPPTEPRR